MYKFTNGVVVYDEATRDKYIKAGMTLVKQEVKKKEEEQVGEENTYSKSKQNKFEKTSKRTERFNRSFR